MRPPGASKGGSGRLQLMLALLGLAAMCLQRTAGLRMASVQIPALVERQTNFWLACNFELASQDQLYGVKWYKDNEEFYRLQPAGSSAGSPAPDWPPATDEPERERERERERDQQHYFAQAGVNVMMSSSNATHVRLLNASLESEGLYACEISSQNLSTIRYERELRVYSLPQSRLNIIGLKSRYSVNDSIDLICAADYSRPRPALAWFINGQRIARSGQHFTLEASSEPLRAGAGSQRQSRGRPAEAGREPAAKVAAPPSPTIDDSSGPLSRLSLGLRFRLTSQLLARLLAGSARPGAGLESRAGAHTDARGSKRPAGAFWSMSASAAASSPGAGEPALGDQQQQPPPPPIRLQCKYRLAEVSEVTFSELEITSGQALGERGAALALSKSPAPDNRLLQNRPAESAHEVQRLLAGLAEAPGSGSGSGSSCGGGLAPDDPLLVAVRGGAQSSGDAEAADGEPPKRALADLDEPAALLAAQDERASSAGDESAPARLRLNCSTRAALLPADDGAAQCEGRALISGRHASSESERGQQQRAGWPAALGGLLAAAGKQHSSPLVAPSSPSSSASAQQQHHVAYLALVAGAGQLKSLPRAAQGNTLSAGADESAAADESVGAPFGAPALTPPASASSPFSSPPPPPLLEWFINNQEAPHSSAHYAPSLPTIQQRGRGPGDALDQAPPVDYAEYFANFESRPQQQHLMLNMTLEKRFFMTPDSKLRLKCSSTKAQLLWVDSATALIVPIYGDSAGHASGWRTRSQAHHHHQTGGARSRTSPPKSLNQTRSSGYAMRPSKSRGSPATAKAASLGLAALSVGLAHLASCNWPRAL